MDLFLMSLIMYQVLVETKMHFYLQCSLQVYGSLMLPPTTWCIWLVVVFAVAEDILSHLRQDALRLGLNDTKLKCCGG